MTIMGIMTWLLISIIVIMVSILILKFNPTIGLIFGSLVMGWGCGMSLLETVNTIGAGFGNLMAGIGLAIGLGVILGQLLEECGGARVIAETLVRKASDKYALYAIGGAGFLLSIPVFFDITFIILAPLTVELSKQLKKPLPYAVGAVTISAAAAHTLVPPTPNPLAAASILHFDLGIMMIAGLTVGSILSFLSMKIYFKLLDHGFWNKEEDETGVLQLGDPAPLPKGAPCFGAALLPLLLPVVCIILSTVSDMLGIKLQLITFLSNRIIAMLIGTVAAYVIAVRALKGKGLEKSASKALEASGVVLLITGASGSFGAVISKTGFADIVKTSLGGITASPLILIFTGFGLAVLFRVALGSGTVASITSMNIMAGVSAGATIHPVFIALSCLAGGISIGHVNDSGYWVVTNMSGYTIKGGLKSYTLGGIFIAFFTMIVCVAAALVA